MAAMGVKWTILVVHNESKVALYLIEDIFALLL